MQDYKQSQSQTQSQIQRFSQRQIQAVKMLAMSSSDLREEIYKFAQENPALEIVSDPVENNKVRIGRDSYSRQNSISSDEFQAAMESNEAVGETLQQHLMSQLNMAKVSQDEYDLCQRLIYNLDKNGFYGSMLAPETLLDKSRPIQNAAMLKKCIERIQNMDPVGVCCKSPEESLYVQAKIAGDAPKLALFLLNGNLEFLNPPDPYKIANKLEKYIEEYGKKSFGAKLPITLKDVDDDLIEEALYYIRTLNPRPAGDYISDSSHVDSAATDVVLVIKKEKGLISGDDYGNGEIYLNAGSYFKITYTRGDIPEVRLSQEMNFDKKIMDEAKSFLENIKFRESTIVLQGCEIVKKQLDFFEKGPGYLKPLTRRQIAQAIGVHESTVSRTSSKKNCKYFQTDWGILPASYFFVSGVSSAEGNGKISADFIKAKIISILEKSQNPVSDSELCRILNNQGINIARRTVTKYRQQAGIDNSYKR